MHKSESFFKSIKASSISLWLSNVQILKVYLWGRYGVQGILRGQRRRQEETYSFEAGSLPKPGAHSFGLGIQRASCSKFHSMEVTDVFQTTKSWSENV